jgi:AraC family transcriptional activator of pobA
MSIERIPRFFLYGEPPREVGDRFLHLESIDDRTRPANWNIRPHAHANLSHVFCIASGGGRMRADTEALPFEGPCLLMVPPNVAHGLAYRPETAGFVLTISDAYLQDLMRREAELRAVFLAPRVLAHPQGQFDDVLERLSRELAWRAPGHAAVVEALLVTLLVGALRLMRESEYPDPRPHGAAAGLVARFRELVEVRYREESRVAAYADALGVTAKRLRLACLRASGAAPLRIIQDRLLVEAKRLMLYSNMTVAETAYYLGFDDPAYFTRFFSKRCGVSPRQFRKTPESAEGRS